jgi:hypothetical protein
MFTAAIAALTRFWGGDQNLLLPLQDDLAGHELLWALVDHLTPTGSLSTTALPPTPRTSRLRTTQPRSSESASASPSNEEVIRRHLRQRHELRRLVVQQHLSQQLLQAGAAGGIVEHLDLVDDQHAASVEQLRVVDQERPISFSYVSTPSPKFPARISSSNSLQSLVEMTTFSRSP